LSGGLFRKGVRLGVDVGTVRVGLAACDPDGILATPVRTLQRDSRRNSDIAVLVRTVVDRGAVEVIVGLPRTLQGKERASAEMARNSAELLVQALGRAGVDVPVRLVDERLSTVSAHSALHAAGVGSREHRKIIDQVAAAGILQHALDMERSLGTSVGNLVPAAPAPDATEPTDAARQREEPDIRPGNDQQGPTQ
jgi:putative Holliday junction resolvase